MIQPKFRGYNKSEKQWFYGHGWFEIDYTEEYLKEKGIQPQAMLYTNDSSPIECELSSMGQFTELFDQEGKEIYEGDVLEIQNGATEDFKHFLAQVHRHESSFDLSEPIYINTIIKQPIPYFIRETGRILGNIHEHKDCIKEWKRRIELENKNRI